MTQISAPSMGRAGVVPGHPSVPRSRAADHDGLAPQAPARTRDRHSSTPWTRFDLELVTATLAGLIALLVLDLSSVVVAAAVVGCPLLLLMLGTFRRHALADPSSTDARRVLSAGISVLVLAAASSPLIAGSPSPSGDLMWLAAVLSLFSLALLALGQTQEQVHARPAGWEQDTNPPERHGARQLGSQPRLPRHSGRQQQVGARQRVVPAVGAPPIVRPVHRVSPGQAENPGRTVSKSVVDALERHTNGGFTWLFIWPMSRV